MRTKHWSLALLACFASAGCGGAESSESSAYSEPVDPPPAESWSMFRADAARTGKSTTAHTGRHKVEELWRVQDLNTTDYGAAKSSPSIVDGVLYIGTDEGKLAAYDADTGDTLWGVMIPDTTHGIHSTPALDAERVYVGAYNGTLYAFDRMGQQVWAFDRGFQVGSSPVVVPEHGRVYSAHERDENGGGWIVSVDARTGERAWEFAIGGHAHSSVAIDVETGRLFVGDNGAVVRCLDTATGEQLWRHALPETDQVEADIKTTPVYVAKHDLVVAGSWDAHVYAFDGTTGDIRWQLDTEGGRVMGSAAYAPQRDVLYVGVLSPTSALYAIEAKTGKRLWKFAAGASVHSSPAIDADESLVVFGANDGNLYALDAATGKEAWRFEVGGKVNASPALVGDAVYVAAANGDLVALHTE